MLLLRPHSHPQRVEKMDWKQGCIMLYLYIIIRVGNFERLCNFSIFFFFFKPSSLFKFQNFQNTHESGNVWTFCSNINSINREFFFEIHEGSKYNDIRIHSFICFFLPSPSPPSHFAHDLNWFNPLSYLHAVDVSFRCSMHLLCFQ